MYSVDYQKRLLSLYITLKKSLVTNYKEKLYNVYINFEINEIDKYI